MGPRARGRVIRLVTGLAVLAVAGAAIYRFAGPGGAAAPKPSVAFKMNAGIPYGTSAQQVLRALGPPTKKDAGCWIYRASSHRVHGVFLGGSVDAVKFCFSGNAVANIYDHHRATAYFHRHQPAGWTIPVVVGYGASPK